MPVGSVEAVRTVCSVGLCVAVSFLSVQRSALSLLVTFLSCQLPLYHGALPFNFSRWNLYKILTCVIDSGIGG